MSTAPSEKYPSVRSHTATCQLERWHRYRKSSKQVRPQREAKGYRLHFG